MEEFNKNNSNGNLKKIKFANEINKIDTIDSSDIYITALSNKKRKDNDFSKSSYSINSNRFNEQSKITTKYSKNLNKFKLYQNKTCKIICKYILYVY